MKELYKSTVWRQWVSVALIVVLTTLNPFASMASGGMGYFSNNIESDHGQEVRYGTPSDAGPATPSDLIEEDDLLEGPATMSNARMGGHLVRFYAIENNQWIFLEEQYVPDGYCIESYCR